MSSEQTVIHLVAGGVAGTVGAVLTCPLEVVKTRLQSSVATFTNPVYAPSLSRVYFPPQQHSTYNYSTSVTNQTQTSTAARSQRPSVGLVSCLRYIIQNEGVPGLFKGLGPNLVGVAPSRAIYFCAYANAKSIFNQTFAPDTPIVHVCSASIAGFTASTCTNPIWFVKTRLQLDQKRCGSITVTQCVGQTYRESGLRGFYKGITASYYGISETVIHFVIYEALKLKIQELNWNGDDSKSYKDFLEFMGAGATSKTIATCIAYPHEVARTRLRQEGHKYKRFWQTLSLVFQEEGMRGLYRGLPTQLVRQIPNTAIMMSTYELVVYLCNRQLMQHQEDVY